MGNIGFWNNNSSKSGNADSANKQEYEKALDAFFKDNPDSGRWTSQDIADMLRETLTVTPNQVFRYMTSHGYRLRRDDDRLVWVIG